MNESVARNACRLLADENFPRRAIEALLDIGFDVESIAQRCAGAPDERVLGIAVDEARILVTYDRDYGELIFHRGCAAPPAVIFIRYPPRNPVEVASTIDTLLANVESILGSMVVVMEQGFRRRKFPPSARHE